MKKGLVSAEKRLHRCGGGGEIRQGRGTEHLADTDAATVKHGDV